MTTQNDNAAKALRYDEITQRAAQERARLEAQSAELQAAAKSLADAIAEATAAVCDGSEATGPDRVLTGRIEPYARELGRALNELCEARERLNAVKHLIGE